MKVIATDGPDRFVQVKGKTIELYEKGRLVEVHNTDFFKPTYSYSEQKEKKKNGYYNEAAL